MALERPTKLVSSYGDFRRATSRYSPKEILRNISAEIGAF